MPEFADRLGYLEDWKQASLLSVESSRCPTWYRPGLLLIGDAAHVMGPIGAVGINCAIQDAVVAANVLTEPLKKSQMQLKDLDFRYLTAVQRRREWSTRFIQGVQALMQRRVLASALRSDVSFTPPLLLRLLLRVPILRDLPGYIFAFGIWPVRVKNWRLKNWPAPVLVASLFRSVLTCSVRSAGPTLIFLSYSSQNALFGAVPRQGFAIVWGVNRLLRPLPLRSSLLSFVRR
ncbi:MAG: FAD-dependent monooxygenase [Rubrobacter sp.]|nr:FAD-dependent monooxygenase [Rubrobacter sp.]